MKIEFDLRKSAAENASECFDKSKKAKKKLENLQKAIVETEKRIEEMKQKEAVEIQSKVLVKKRKKDWFERFHWFNSSNGLLVLAGRDAQSNEELVKKYMEKDDVYFHSDIHGAAHCIVKAKKNSAPKESMEEAAIFAAVFSSAWKSGLAAIDVYSVLPEQVSKKAPSGESMGAGAFMIYGKRNWFKKTPLKFAIGLEKNSTRVISGPPTAIKKSAGIFFEIVLGEKSKGDVAKKLIELFQKKLGKTAIDLDEIMSMLPNGGMKLVE